ncbi:MAG: translation initiation factor [Prevotellaceae bacterium]|jgi:translation initiation factor 1|nr:translation initiation factor [Prevotellaceae bacterium]
MAKPEEDWKAHLRQLYPVNPDSFTTDCMPQASQTASSPVKQTLRIELDKHHRKGNAVTLVSGFVGTDAELTTLARTLKIACGVGGSARDGEILLQGDVRYKTMQLLSEMGYRCKPVGFSPQK